MAGVIDLIAAEAKYHLACFQAFKRSTEKVKQRWDNSDIAMIWLAQELSQSAEKGHVLLLNDVWERYEQLAEESSTRIQPSFYSRRATFREKLESQVGKMFAFFQPLDRGVSERKAMLIPREYQSSALLKMAEMEDNDILPPHTPDDDTLSLVHVALKIRGDIIDTPNHQGFSVTEEGAISYIPDSLYNFMIKM